MPKPKDINELRDQLLEAFDWVLIILAICAIVWAFMPQSDEPDDE